MFEIDEVSADKAYLSVENFEEVAAMGGQAFINFKSNSTGLAGGLFEKRSIISSSTKKTT